MPANASPTGSPDPARARRARRYIGVARLILWWERVWPALWPALGFVGAYAMLALFGVLPLLPGGIHVLLVLGLTGAAGYFLWRRFSRVHAPVWSEAARRLERDSKLAHRPITEADDTIAAGKGDAVSESLWRTHMMRLFASAKRLRLKLPKPGLGRDDRYYLRFAVLAGVIGGIVFAGSDSWHRLTEGFAPVIGARTQAVVTAWVSPPSYTGRAPLSLDAARHDAQLSVPQHSILVIRITGTESQPSLHIRPTPNRNPPTSNTSPRAPDATISLESDTVISAKLGVHTLGEWNFKVEHDRGGVGRFCRAAVGERASGAEAELSRQRRLRRRQDRSAYRAGGRARQRRRQQRDAGGASLGAGFGTAGCPRRSFAILPHTPMRG